MWFHDDNTKVTVSRDWENRMVMQKEIFPVNAALRTYLQHYGRDIALPVLYHELANYSYANSIKDKRGKWTHWENAVYEPAQLLSLQPRLVSIYITLKKLPATREAMQFDIEQIDFCDYGNSIPFRIKISERAKEQHDFFYVKQADASRIYGLELEHLLTSNPINFLCHQNTLIEEHIEGIPADTFLQLNAKLAKDQKTSLAKAFVQFNESCFVRLLGDMRSYNFVVATDYFDKTAVNQKEKTTGGVNTPDPGQNKQVAAYRLRAIDFDQQCYEGRKILYFPKFYKENKPYVDMVLQNLSSKEIADSQQIEFTAMAARIITYRRRLMELLNSMVNDDISENYKIQLLRSELNDHFNTSRFDSCKTMGAIVKQQLKQVLQKHVQMVSAKSS